MKVNAQKVLSGLKDFQLKSVENAFERLYGTEGVARFLIADEVGLGKTLVARGLIALAIEHIQRSAPKERIDVIYICSNGSIARQNIRRLNVTDKKEFSHANRITLLPTVLKELNQSPINFISFTPDTSFNLRSNSGIMEERALLFFLLRREWQLRGAPAYNIFQCDARTRWRDYVDDCVRYYEKVDSVDEGLAQRFLSAIRDRGDLREEFEQLIPAFSRIGSHTHEDSKRRNKLIGDLRSVLAKVCIDALEPDLVILDEFQRFKSILDGDNEAALLARDLFEYSKAKLLLLSATPYKMYTLNEEELEEDHYADFLRTTRFLFGDPEKSDRLATLLSEFRNRLLGDVKDNINGLVRTKVEIEGFLRQVMSRVERLSTTADRSGMISTIPPATSTLSPLDLASYLQLHPILQSLGVGDCLEYWKSAPYLLSFMDSYQVKARLKEECESSSSEEELLSALRGAKSCFLSPDTIRNYEPVEPHNSKLRALMAHVFKDDVPKLLWAPPAIPYYRSEGPYASPNAASFTKTLVFSSWNVVPKMIASLVSYEADRMIVGEAIEKKDYWGERPKRLLQFSESAGRLTGLPALALQYPCLTLAEEIDPATLGRGIKTMKEVIELATRQVDEMLNAIPSNFSYEGSRVDERWYWAAPLLLDRRKHAHTYRQFFSGDAEGYYWGYEENESEDDAEKHNEHISHFAKCFNEGMSLGRRPADLSVVLAKIALGAPGVASLRALLKAQGNDIQHSVALLFASTSIAESFRSYFNHPEAISLLQIDKETPYWLKTVEYGIEGNIQAVLDEYVHILKESLGLTEKSIPEQCEELSDHIQEVLTLRTASLYFDELHLSETNFELRRHALRCRFALAFGDQKNEDGKTDRAEHVRAAFNSPFYPFVLASTSIGQEGLDFHQYCHSIFHWNLPRNPVDLEQREGRIHRYKGHVIRKNLPLRFSPKDFRGDIWSALFDAASKAKPMGTDDLSPYWVLDAENGHRIERHVPHLPLSREGVELEQLLRTVALYRMVFGQPRQEELVKFLEMCGPFNEGAELAKDLAIDLAPILTSKKVA